MVFICPGLFSSPALPFPLPAPARRRSWGCPAPRKVHFHAVFEGVEQPGVVTRSRRPGASGGLSPAAERPQGLPPAPSPRLQIPGHGDPNPPRPAARCQQGAVPSCAEVVVPAVGRPAEGGRDTPGSPPGGRRSLPPPLPWGPSCPPTTPCNETQAEAEAFPPPAASIPSNCSGPSLTKRLESVLDSIPIQRGN